MIGVIGGCNRRVVIGGCNLEILVRSGSQHFTHVIPHHNRTWGPSLFRTIIA